MALTIPVAHDVICGWCWIGVLQAEKLKEEFDIEFDWLGYELMPEELAWPEPKTPKEVDLRRAATPSRLELAYAASGIELPSTRPPSRMRSHNVLEAIEYAKSVGMQEPFIGKVYRAHWEGGKTVNEPDVLACLAKGLLNVEEMMAAVRERKFAGNIVPFDDAAHEAGIFNVPTFTIGGKKYAEQPLSVLRNAIKELMP